MKKIITIIVGISLCLSAMAQPQYAKKRVQKENKTVNKEELVEKKCKAVVEKLKLDEATSAKFIPLYKEYLNELSSRFEMKNEELNDADIDKKVKEGFGKTRKMIDIREKYYNEFRKFLTPEQAKMVLNGRDGKGMRAGKNMKGEKGEKRNVCNENNDEKKEMLKKRMNFSHDKKKLNESQTVN